MFQVTRDDQARFSSNEANQGVKLIKEEVPLTLSRRRFNEAMRSVCQLPPFNKGLFCGSLTFREEPAVTVKACTCASGSCLEHLCSEGSCSEARDTEPPKPPPLLRSSGTFIADSKPQNKSKSRDPNVEKEVNTSMSALSSLSVRDDTFQKWLADKNQSKREVEQQKLVLEQAIAEEKAKKQDLERRNFLQWLENKKVEARRKASYVEEKARKKAYDKKQKEKKQLENDLNFQLWRKRKEERYLENKLKEHVEKLRTAEARKKRIEMNEAAYEEWYKNSRNKQKPLPMNRGLDSLRASVSVSYINPTPWEPNIPKPTTQ